MQICLSLQNETTLSPHFGESARFVLMNSATGVCSPHCASDSPCRGPCHCHIPESTDHHFGAVICRAIGHRVLLEYQRRGIAVYLTAETNPAAAWQLWKENRLTPASRSTCRTGRRKPAQSALSAPHPTEKATT